MMRKPLQRNPKRTHALVVGLEAYGLAGSDLDGAGHDALLFVEWLRARGVPGEQILACISPLPANRKLYEEHLAELQVSWHGGTLAEVENCLAGKLHAAEGDVLYFYWGGHGIADANGNQYLFCSDATTELRNRYIDILVWMAKLRSYRFDVQIGYVDACANFRQSWNLGVNQPSITTAAAGRPQSFLFAASAGQRAAQNTVERTGKFSHLLREVLKERGVRDGDWPPHPDDIFDALDARFRDDQAQSPVCYTFGSLDGSRKVSIGKRPCAEYIESVARTTGFPSHVMQDWADRASRSTPISAARSGLLKLACSHTPELQNHPDLPLGDPREELLWLFAIAADVRMLEELTAALETCDRIAKPLVERIRFDSTLRGLCELLDQEGIPDKALRPQYWRAAVGITAAKDTTNRWEMLGELTGTLDGATQRLHEFVLRVAAAHHSQLLRQWVEDRASKAELRELEEKLSQEEQEETHHLLIWVRGKGIESLTAELFSGKEWQLRRRWPSKKVRPEDIEGTINRILEESEGDFGARRLVLHFLVSHELLHWSPGAIRIDVPLQGNAPLGAHYAVLLRWRERALGMPRIDRLKWEALAAKLFGNPAARVRCSWIDASGEVAPWLNTIGPESPVRGFEFPACRKVQPGSPLAQALLSGAPVLLWPANDPENIAEIKARFETLCEESLETLPDKMKDLHECSSVSSSCLTLFFDNPKETPPKWEYRDDL